ncbi:PepSY-associated TM helix domain-containing protein [Roseivirga sp. E12]|uniref:PepSY-associated TM helix domain-containing protein n=1 Tax=Roseivirga sp. E12 TaxID=2819237 RepID=UPI001ABBFF15|nr:PepSY-associated TM helix domain-containing protein [Roseivirga sp. E12]MBO3698637.1 PepSY-associated TM helix domain-containing protein [Roseivirga sp. E12]
MSQKFRNFCRNYHRDIAYIFVGLILAFSISGIALNHRRTFNSRQFVYESEAFNMPLPADVELITKEFVESKLPEIGIGNEYKSFRIQNGELRIFYDKARAEINLETGVGEKEWYGKRILLKEMADLHQTTNPAWIWYSDIFGIAMIFIALSGMFISSGKNSFKKRGWYMALIGMLFPLIFLIFIM